jgi:Skp family chaperone for outer membrane proteins
VIVRDAGVPEGEPMIRLRLKAVPLGQLLQVLCTAHPEIQISPVEAENGPVVQVIRIRATEQTEAAANAGPKVVRVYPLSNEILSVLRTRGELAPMGAPEKELAQKGLEHVLSLIKNVIEAAGERTAATLAVHVETQSLIVTGTAEQHLRVQDTLAALRGEQRPFEQQQVLMARAAQQLRDMRSQSEDQIGRLHREVDRLKVELDETRNEARKTDAQAREAAIEAERRQVRLEEALSRGAAAKTQERPTDSEKGTTSTPGAK